MHVLGLFRKGAGGAVVAVERHATPLPPLQDVGQGPRLAQVHDAVAIDGGWVVIGHHLVPLVGGLARVAGAVLVWGDFFRRGRDGHGPVVLRPGARPRPCGGGGRGVMVVSSMGIGMSVSVERRIFMPRRIRARGGCSCDFLGTGAGRETAIFAS